MGDKIINSIRTEHKADHLTDDELIASCCPKDYGYESPEKLADCNGECNECWNKEVDYMRLIADIVSNNRIPLPVLQDVDKRTSDWLASGGKVTDDYIKQQYRYLKNVVESLNRP